MADQPLPQDFVLQMIQAFTEHPDSLAVLLRNPQINAALAHYLDAAADALRPKAGWREIYSLRGDVPRVWMDFDPARAPDILQDDRKPDYPVKVVPLMQLLWDDSARIARAVGGFTEAERIFYMDTGRTHRRVLVQKVALFEDYTAAIQWADSVYAEVVLAFEASTEPIPIEPKPLRIAPSEVTRWVGVIERLYKHVRTSASHQVKLKILHVVPFYEIAYYPEQQSASFIGGITNEGVEDGHAPEDEIKVPLLLQTREDVESEADARSWGEIRVDYLQDLMNSVTSPLDEAAVTADPVDA